MIFIKKRYIISLLLFVMLFTSCEGMFKKEVKVGFISDITGNNSNLSISARNGLEMAILEINASGGVLGKEVSLFTKDHKGSQELSLSLTKELVSEDMDIIIGPITSSMATSVIDGSTGEDIIVIGPTVSSELFTGIDDHFFKITAPSSIQGVKIGEVLNEKRYEKVDIVFDLRNNVYAVGVIRGLKNTTPGIDYHEISFDSSDNFDRVVEEIETRDADALFFISNGPDTGEILQNLTKIGYKADLYGSSWVKATDVKKYGGQIVEGMTLVDTFVNRNKSERELEFRRRYMDRFNIEANIIVMYFYEALYIYKDAVERAKSFSFDKVKEEMVNFGEVEGITEKYILDEFGDGYRNMSLFQIINGDYVLIDEN